MKKTLKSEKNQNKTFIVNGVASKLLKNKQQMRTMEDIDIDFQMIDDLRVERKPKKYKERFSPFELSDEEFFSRYRLDKVATRFLISLLHIEESKNNRGLPISKDLQVLTILRFLGRNAHQNDIADLHGMSQQTVGRIIKKVAKQIALLLPNFIKFPCNAEIVEVKSQFYQLARFPNVVGAIDCTHVRIKCPAKKVGRDLAGHYINRKGYYSLNVQIVCDADCKITDIVARSRGSKHDSRIWSECKLKAKLELNKRYHNGVLLGDAGYPLSTILLTPIRNPSTAKEENYNKCHIATRSKIECLNGQLKSKFRSIFERLRVDLDTAKNVVVAVAVLHNIAKERNSSFLYDCPSAQPRAENCNINSGSNLSSGSALTTNSANAFRTAFVNAYF